jgi:hypothetical protein
LINSDPLSESIPAILKGNLAEAALMAENTEIPPEYFLEYRIDKLTKLLKDNPSIADDVFNYAQELARKNNLIPND